jgi:cyclic pyranopterin phosphate synthase
MDHAETVLSDKYNRNINYLRISITDRCNLKCIYCRPGGKILKLAHDDILRYEEILRVIRICSDLGLQKIRITGGEPLVRKGIGDFLNSVSRTPGIRDVSLTTNGILLSDNLQKIKDCGIRRLNISLDSLDRHKYFTITGFDGFDRVWNSILKALDLDFHPIKINVVALRGINEDEILRFAELTFSYPFHVRFIEQMPIGNPILPSRNPILSDEIKTRLTSLGKLEPVAGERYDGPARRYQFRGAKGEIGIISPISHHFCETCNRLRLTADGRLRPCLLSDHHEDLKTPLRSGCSDQDLVDLILMAIRNKPSRHQLSSGHLSEVITQMSSIGG